jgi:uncharacterized membrane protein
MVRRGTAVLALVAVAVWLGGLVVLGAIVAPTIFGQVSFPASADAMTLVFRRFDAVAMSCAAILLTTEALRALARVPFARIDHARAAAALLASAAAVMEGASVSPRIAALHAAGALRGRGADGLELDRLHHLAEMLGKAEVALLLLVIVLQVLSWPMTQRALRQHNVRGRLVDGPGTRG